MKRKLCWMQSHGEGGQQPGQVPQPGAAGRAGAQPGLSLRERSVGPRLAPRSHSLYLVSRSVSRGGGTAGRLHPLSGAGAAGEGGRPVGTVRSGLEEPPPPPARPRRTCAAPGTKGCGRPGPLGGVRPFPSPQPRPSPPRVFTFIFELEFLQHPFGGGRELRGSRSRCRRLREGREEKET